MQGARHVIKETWSRMYSVATIMSTAAQGSGLYTKEGHETFTITSRVPSPVPGSISGMKNTEAKSELRIACDRRLLELVAFAKHDEAYTETASCHM